MRGCRRSDGWLARSALSAAFLLGMAFGSTAFAQDQQLPVVTVAKPVVREIVEDDEFVGRFEAVDEVAIRSRVGGYLDKVAFPGRRHRSRRATCCSPSTSAPTRRPTTPPSRRSTSPSSLLEFSKTQLERAEELAKTGNIPVSTLDDRRREYLVGAGADAGREGGAQRRASLDLEFTEIKAPLAGRIDRRLVSVGNLVQADPDAADDDRLARSDRLLFRRR